MDDDGSQTERPEGVLPDPYVGAPPPPPPPVKRGFSRWALGGLLSAALLGPLGAVLAIVLGFLGRREAEREQHVSGRRWSTFALVLGALLAPVWGVGASYLLWSRILDDHPPTFEPGLVASTPRPRPRRPAEIPSAAPLFPSRVEREGKITVVDIGQDAPSLAESLGHQRAEATRAKETLVLMTTAGGCEPCEGVASSLRDPLLQNALANVRLVRVDVRIFHDDLEELRISDDHIPGFYLLGQDFSPRDGIDGGEWDDDIAVNIAPVLGAFVRGKYVKRREPWRPMPGSGVTL